MLRNHVDSAGTPIRAARRWYWLVLGVLYSLLGAWHLTDGTWWLGLVGIVGGAGWVLAWLRRVGLYRDGDSIVLRGAFREKRIAIDTIGDVGESLPVGPVVPADAEWSRGPFVLFLQNGSEIHIENYLPTRGRRRDRALDEIRGWFSRVQHPA